MESNDKKLLQYNLKMICCQFSRQILFSNLENGITNFEDFRNIAKLRGTFVERILLSTFLSFFCLDFFFFRNETQTTNKHKESVRSDKTYSQQTKRQN